MPAWLVDLRLKYVWSDDARKVLDNLVDLGLLTRAEDMLTATAQLHPLLDAIEHARFETAAYVWTEQQANVEPVLEPARKIALNASADHELAALYRDLPEPDEEPALLLRRLTCLRYVRHHCHVEAWKREGLDGPSMPAFTALWKGEAPGDDAHLDLLTERGFIEGDPPALTAYGRETRDRIERFTDERAQISFDVMSPDHGAQLVNDLRRLTVPPQPG